MKRACVVCGSAEVVGGLELCPEGTRGMAGHRHLAPQYCRPHLLNGALVTQACGFLVTVVAEGVVHGALRRLGIMGVIQTPAEVVDGLIAELRAELDPV